MPRGATALLSTITALLLLAGCGMDAEPFTTMTPTVDVQGFPKGTAPQSGEATRASGLVLVDVRVAVAEDFDRIVLEFSGTGSPGWFINYVDEAVLDGSGKVVDLGGRASLDIYASNTTWPAPDYYEGPTRVVPESSGNVTDVYVGGTFEGTTQVLAGIDGAPVPFRAFTLTEPSRLVIDVAD